MNIEIRDTNADVALLSLSGELDMSTSTRVRDALTPIYKKNVKGIVVDLAGVTYMDSSGIATMIEGLQWSKSGSRRFVVAGLCDAVMDVFVLTNLKDVFEFATDAESAVNDIAGS